MKLVLNIDELDILKIEKGQKVEIEAAALPNETFDAVVENVSIQGKAEGGVTTYPITVRIDKIGKLMPGMNVTGNIYAATKNQPDSSRRIYSPQAAKTATITSRNQTKFDATLKQIGRAHV